jgi:hypothetical protein
VTLLESVCAYLRQLAVPHAVIGASALAVHGVSRSTFDQDLLVTNRRVLDDAFWQDFGVNALIDPRRGDHEDPLAGVVRIQRGDERTVDLIVGRHSWQEEILARAEPIPESDGLQVVRAADLVLLKLYAGGSQDRWDIEQLMAVDESGGLVPEVESRLALLPKRCADLWRGLRDPA